MKYMWAFIVDLEQNVKENQIRYYFVVRVHITQKFHIRDEMFLFKLFESTSRNANGVDAIYYSGWILVK